ncbi:MAG: BTAD domain-containing putative transcriptional regulator, partial [Anaerolineales bacterium]
SQAYIRSVVGGYRFDPESVAWIDVEALESAAARGRSAQEAGAREEAIAAYEEARRLYRGDLLEEDRYAEWTFAERERLVERYLTLLTELEEAYAQQGRYRRAISLCQRILERDPYREAVFVRLMLAYYYAGEQVQALRTFERCRRVLMEDLGVAPHDRDALRHSHGRRRGRSSDPVAGHRQRLALGHLHRRPDRRAGRGDAHTDLPGRRKLDGRWDHADRTRWGHQHRILLGHPPDRFRALRITRL